MKRAAIPRPPLLIGFILGPLAERYLWRSYSIYEWEWVLRPGVMVIAIIAILPVLAGILVKERSGPQRTLTHPDPGGNGSGSGGKG